MCYSLSLQAVSSYKFFYSRVFKKKEKQHKKTFEVILYREQTLLVDSMMATQVDKQCWNLARTPFKTTVLGPGSWVSNALVRQGWGSESKHSTLS